MENMNNASAGAYKEYASARDYLFCRLEGDFPDLGVDDDKAKEKLSAVIIDKFEKAIYRGKDCEHYFLVGESGDVYMYNGRYYESSNRTEDMLNNVVKDVMEDIGLGVVYQKKVYKEVTKQCLSGMRVRHSAMFKPDRNYIVFANGVFDISKGELLPFSMKYHTDLIFEYEYSKNAYSALWQNFVEQTIPNDDMRMAFQMFCGAFLCDRNKFTIEYICYLIGTGRNGKSVLTGAIASMFGSRLISNFSPQELFTDYDKKYNRAGLVGKVANLSDDVSKKDFSGGAFKQFVSGKPMSARSMYNMPFDLTYIPFMLCCVNEMPPTTDDTNGHHRRILPILCPNQVSEKDSDNQLSAKLSTDESKSAIFNWVLEGFKMLVRNGGKIIIGESIREEMEKQKAESNSARRWIKDAGLKAVENPASNDPNWRSMNEWMSMYRTWCKDIGEMEKTAPAVGKIFAERGFKNSRRSQGMYWCIRIEPDSDEFEGVKPDNELPF
jgi:P4 family phage/plasmid primase-like protien